MNRGLGLASIIIAIAAAFLGLHALEERDTKAYVMLIIRKIEILFALIMPFYWPYMHEACFDFCIRRMKAWIRDRLPWRLKTWWIMIDHQEVCQSIAWIKDWLYQALVHMLIKENKCTIFFRNKYTDYWVLGIVLYKFSGLNTDFEMIVISFLTYCHTLIFEVCSDLMSCLCMCDTNENWSKYMN